MLKLLVCVMILVNTLVINECQGHIPGGYYRHSFNVFINPTPTVTTALSQSTASTTSDRNVRTYNYHDSVQQLKGTFTKVIREVSTQVTADFVTTVDVTVMANTTVTSTTTITSTLTPSAISSSKFVTSTATHLNAVLSVQSLTAGAPITAGDVICNVVAMALAANNQFRITSSTTIVTSTVVPQIECGITTITAG